MTAPNGHAQKDHAPASGLVPAVLIPGALQVLPERIKEFVAALEVPFDPSQIEWRVMNTTKKRPARGQVVPGHSTDRCMLSGRHMAYLRVHPAGVNGIFSRLPARSMTDTAPSPRFGRRRI